MYDDLQKQQGLCTLAGNNQLLAGFWASQIHRMSFGGGRESVSDADDLLKGEVSIGSPNSATYSRVDMV